MSILKKNNVRFFHGHGFSQCVVRRLQYIMYILYTSASTVPRGAFRSHLLEWAGATRTSIALKSESIQ